VNLNDIVSTKTLRPISSDSLKLLNSEREFETSPLIQCDPNIHVLIPRVSDLTGIQYPSSIVQNLINDDRPGHRDFQME
jgi:hypothetical protein